MSKVKSYTDKQLLDRVKSLKNFKEIPTNYWILGVRGVANSKDEFIDKFYLFNGEKFMMVASGTTRSGLYGLKNYKKWNREGTFVIKSDYWHYDLWKSGLHKGKMKALVQANDVVGYRDGDMDEYNEELGIESKGKFGINFHTVSYNKVTNYISKLIGQWSVGCQVINDVDKYYRIIEKVEEQKTITYCLINEF